MKRQKFSLAVFFAVFALAGALWLGRAPMSDAANAAERDVANLRQLSQAFIDVSKDVRPSVVNISTTRSARKALGRGRLPETPFDDFFDRFFKDTPERPPQAGLGSGVIYSSDGLILTNAHVVDGADEIKVNLFDERSFDAEVKGIDEKSDLAVLKIDADNLPAARLGDSDALEVGEIVMAIGTPFGLNQTVTSGIVSAKGRYGMGIEAYENFIQTDAAINPGNSGGPLVSLDGEVIGINTAILSRSGAYQGIGFAIPVNMARNIATQLIEKGEVTRGWLGVSIQQVTPELAGQFELEEGTKGVLITEVHEGTPAFEAGMQAGDVIIAYNDKPVTNINELRHSVANTVPGTKMDVTVLRRGKEKLLQVEVAEQTSEALAQARGAIKPEEVQSVLGMTVQEFTPEIARELGIKHTEGVIVSDVTPDGPAAKARIRRGDVVKEIRQQNISSVEDFNAALGKVKPGDKVLMLVDKKQARQYVVVTVPKD